MCSRKPVLNSVLTRPSQDCPPTSIALVPYEKKGKRKSGLCSKKIDINRKGCSNSANLIPTSAVLALYMKCHSPSERLPAERLKVVTEIIRVINAEIFDIFEV